MAVINTALILNDLPSPPPEKAGWPWTRQSKVICDKRPDGSEWPRISVVTPSYNQGKFIEATIRSVLLQGYPNLEYIIIDGDSTDRTIEVVKKYEGYLSYWISEKDRGQTHAINKGVEKSSGDILAWINSDDVYTKGTLQNIARSFHSQPDCVVVHGNRILIDENGDVTGWLCLPPFDPKTGIFNVCSETAFWSRSAMNQAGLLNENLQFAMDLEFFGRLYKCGKFLKMNEYLGYFRCHAANKSSNLQHIGQEEAEREWKNLFGSENMNFRSPSNSNYLKLGLSLIRHPVLIGLPYLLHRLIK